MIEERHAIGIVSCLRPSGQSAVLAVLIFDHLQDVNVHYSMVCVWEMLSYSKRRREKYFQLLGRFRKLGRCSGSMASGSKSSKH